MQGEDSYCVCLFVTIPVDNDTIQCNLYVQHPKTDAGHYCVYEWFNETKWHRSLSGKDASVITKQFVGHAKMKCLTAIATVNKGVWSAANKFVFKMQWLKFEVLRWGKLTLQTWVILPHAGQTNEYKFKCVKIINTFSPKKVQAVYLHPCDMAF